QLHDGHYAAICTTCAQVLCALQVVSYCVIEGTRRPRRPSGISTPLDRGRAIAEATSRRSKAASPVRAGRSSEHVGVERAAHSSSETVSTSWPRFWRQLIQVAPTFSSSFS